MKNASILVVDDEAGILTTIRDILSDEGYTVLTASDADEARAIYNRQSLDLVLLDIWMPGTDGISLLKEWSSEAELKCPVVIMSGHGTVETAVEATRLGALDFIEKPLSLAQLLTTIEGALEQRLRPARSAAGMPPPRAFEMPPVRSAAMRAACEQAAVIARQSVPLLITGEAGAGRENFARFIHSMAFDGDVPFVQVSGAALTEDGGVDALVGSAGAEPGLLQQATSGTLFINDLQDTGQRVQGLLLAVLEQGGYARPGRTLVEAADVRIMASVQDYSGETLRADLIALLGVAQLAVPALRDCPDDVPLLLRYYVDQLVLHEKLGYRRFTVAAQNRLRNYPWPGNVRELRNLVRRLLLNDGSLEIGLDELEACLTAPLSAAEPLVKQDVLALPMREAREQFERTYLRQQLALCGGKVGKLAERVGMERTHLYRKLRSLGIDFRQGGIDD